MVITDFVVLALMAWIALVLRGDGFFNINSGYELSGATSTELYQFITLASVITIAVLLKMRLYRSIVRYINLDTYVNIAKACLLSTGIFCKSFSGIIFKNSKNPFNADQCSCSVLKNNSVEEASAPNKLFNTII